MCGTDTKCMSQLTDAEILRRVDALSATPSTPNAAWCEKDVERRIAMLEGEKQSDADNTRPKVSNTAPAVVPVAASSVSAAPSTPSVSTANANRSALLFWVSSSESILQQLFRVKVQ